MTIQTLETDYLLIGAGAMGMAFMDEVLTRDKGAHFILVDKHAKPGGHWNDAYPFVSLHQPAAYYGVNSEKLGSGGAALASGTEVLSYFDRVLGKWVAAGRVQYFPMCEFHGDGRFSSLVARDREYEVKVRRKTVDASYSQVTVPAMGPPAFPVASEVSLVPLNRLSDVREPQSGYVIIGAGKTGMDAALFLLDRGVDPDHITWIMPNDAWLLDRAQIQPGRMADGGRTAQMESIAEASNLEELFLSLEAKQLILRLDKSVWPTKYRCATVSLEELDQLRSIRNVVRKGRVVRIEPTSIVLQNGSFATDSSKLHVDCTADGLKRRDILPVFNGEQITLQSLFMCQQVLSAAIIGQIETRYDDDAKKNELAKVVPHPEFTLDFLGALATSMSNVDAWAKHFGMWLRGSRLCFIHHESLFALIWMGIQSRKIVPRAMERIEVLLK